MHKARRNRNPNKAEAKSAAGDCAELPHTPLIVHVIAKMIDHPFMFSFSPEKQFSSGLSGAVRPHHPNASGMLTSP